MDYNYLIESLYMYRMKRRNWNVDFEVFVLCNQMNYTAIDLSKSYSGSSKDHWCGKQNESDGIVQSSGNDRRSRK